MKKLGWMMVCVLAGCAVRDNGSMVDDGAGGSVGGADAAGDDDDDDDDDGATSSADGADDAPADDGIGDAGDGMDDAGDAGDAGDDDDDDAGDDAGDDGPDGPPGYHCDTMEAFCPVELPEEGSPCCEDADGQWCCDAPEGSDCYNFCFASSFGCGLETCEANGTKYSVYCSDGVWQSTATDCRCLLDCGAGQVCLHTSEGCGIPDCVPPPPTEECVPLPAECGGVPSCDCAADMLCPIGECVEEGGAIICEIPGA